MVNFSIGHGSSRFVILVGRTAYKIPRIDRWRRMLTGLLANLDEVSLSKQGFPRLCPIRWALPGGFLVAMVRATPLSTDDAERARLEFDNDECFEALSRSIPESKLDAFMELDGDWVIVDYGGIY
jgi:hypothetical protein